MLLKILFRNSFRRPLRTVLTVFGICVAILAFGLLRTVIDAWHAGVEASSAYRLVTRNAISLVFSLPLSYKEKIRGVEGVTSVSVMNWFGGIYIDEKNFFANFAVEPRSFLNLYPEYLLTSAEEEAFFRDRRGCVAGRRLADRFGWRIGDSITLQGTIFPGDWEFVLRGIYRGRDNTVDENQFFFHWNYLNESIKKRHSSLADQVGIYVFGISDPDQAAQVANAVDALFKNSFAETLTETEKAFQMGFIALSQAILTAVRLVSLVVIAIILAVVANTMAMSVRERMGEYAVFKTLGFGGMFLGAVILGEALWLTLMGGILGIVLTFPAARFFGDAVGNYFPVFIVSRDTILLDLLAVFVVGFLAAVVPVWRAVTVPIAEGLRRIG